MSNDYRHSYDVVNNIFDGHDMIALLNNTHDAIELELSQLEVLCILQSVGNVYSNKATDTSIKACLKYLEQIVTMSSKMTDENEVFVNYFFNHHIKMTV